MSVNSDLCYLVTYKHIKKCLVLKLFVNKFTLKPICVEKYAVIKTHMSEDECEQFYEQFTQSVGVNPFLCKISWGLSQTILDQI